ncbi:MAG TPA: hypothetical protein VGK94_03885 [Candidatus Polarisedimenticolia bacterium]|jgi:hypothetical protein
MKMGHIDLRAALRVASAVAVALLSSTGRPMSLNAEALARVVARLETKVVALKIDLHEPDPGADSMQAPTLERKGWHHDNPTGPVALRAGSRVEVTGVFNYSERGVFLELSQVETTEPQPSTASRPRIRIRLMVETPDTDPEGQRAEAIDLIGKVLELPAEP